jgi:hypothetical protein
LASAREKPTFLALAARLTGVAITPVPDLY